MDTDPAFICPRPRNPRACDKCRARKIRCLPADKRAEEGACRRCVKLGYACCYASSSTDPRNGRYNGDSRGYGQQKRGDDRNGRVEDVVSDLCDSKVSAAEEVDKLLDFHQRAFAKQTEETTFSTANNNTIPTPESMPSTNATGLRPQEKSRNLSMPEAESLLAIFRQHERQKYFPFVTLPSSITASQMTRSQPFLLLAILTVCSSRNPGLQARTDKRFRRVLSDRVMLNGEKGLDYMRGLLVYIAWCPMHLRPLQNQNQIMKYMRIAVDMALDLGLDTDFENRTQEEKDVYLGCCYIPSFVHGQLLTKPQEARRNMSLPLPSWSQFNTRGPVNDGVYHLRLQELVRQITRYMADLSGHGPAERENFPTPQPQGEYIVEEKIIEFKQELGDIIYALPCHMRNTTPTILTTQYIRLSIAYIPLKPILQRKHNQISGPSASPSKLLPITQILKHATTTFTEVTTFLNTFLSLPKTEYLRLSIREWSQLILTLITSSNLCFSSPECPISRLTSSTAKDWEVFQTKAHAQILVYLESLTQRMRTLSVPSVSSTSDISSSGIKGNKEAGPDMFAMMESILGILIKRYDVSTARQTSTSASCLERRSSSRCPVLNGAIRDTDFWRSLESTQMEDIPAAIAIGSPCGGASKTTEGSCANPTSALNVDDLVKNPQDWPSIFEEWVVDLNYLPE
ncbi:hypothetical protein BDW69DRAFT_86737 [Aspergillus filifer]